MAKYTEFGHNLVVIIVKIDSFAFESKLTIGLGFEFRLGCELSLCLQVCSLVPARTL